jgi:hypothetical protein
MAHSARLILDCGAPQWLVAVGIAGARFEADTPLLALSGRTAAHADRFPASFAFHIEITRRGADRGRGWGVETKRCKLSNAILAAVGEPARTGYAGDPVLIDCLEHLKVDVTLDRSADDGGLEIHESARGRADALFGSDGKELAAIGSAFQSVNADLQPTAPGGLREVQSERQPKRVRKIAPK